ncbi:MAG: hypothetical protein AAGF84_10805 [Planctomycetota bacterium]
MRGLYPSDTVPTCLPEHESVGTSDRPTFFARFLSGAEELDLAERVDLLRRRLAEGQLRGAAAVEATIDFLTESIHGRLGTPGWQNVADRDGQPVPFTKDGVKHLIAHALTIDQAQRLITRLEDAVRFNDTQLGNSPSPWGSPAATTAPTAPASLPTTATPEETPPATPPAPVASAATDG